MKAVSVYLIIKKEKGQVRTSKSGLDIPAEMNDRFIKASIISASELGKEEFGLEAGQEVLYDKHAGHEFKGVDGESYRIITCRDVAVVL
jgi:co-chaperonin GroES (HSP10)